MQSSQPNPFAGIPGQTPPQQAPMPASPLQQFNPVAQNEEGGGKGGLIVLVIIVLILIGGGAYYYLSSTGALPGGPTPTPSTTPEVSTSPVATPIPTPTPTVDPNAPAIDFKSDILDLTMTFPGRFGTIMKDKQSSTQGTVCDVETVGFTHVRLQGSFVKGSLSCISTYGGAEKEKYILTSKDGRKLETIVKFQDPEAGLLTVMATFRTDTVGINLGVSDIKTADLDAAKKDLEEVVKTLSLKL